MKNYISLLLLFLIFIASTANVQAQFFKKLQKKIDAKIEQVINPNEKEELTNDSFPGEYQENTVFDSNKFVPGELEIFSDYIGNAEVKNKHPSKWRTTFSNAKDDSEIVEYEGEEVIRLGSRQGISPIITENKEDYLPDNFTLEFDASFSENSPEQRYYLIFYDRKTQVELVEYEARMNEFTLETFGLNDGLTQGTLEGEAYYQNAPNMIWRHIAVSYKNNALDFYYDGEHIYHKEDIKGNLLGIDISRSELSKEDRYLKNIRLATNK